MILNTPKRVSNKRKTTSGLKNFKPNTISDLDWQQDQESDRLELSLLSSQKRTLRLKNIYQTFKEFENDKAEKALKGVKVANSKIIEKIIDEVG